MLRLFAALTTLSVSLLAANPAAVFKPYTTTLSQIQGGTAIIADSEDIVVGSSGIITHRFDEEKSTVIARASVIKKEDGNATIRFEVFDLLAQSAFPLPGLLPEAGDKVTLNYLYDRALIVAPNKTVYNEVTKHFKGITWVHPDLMGAYLASEYKPNPERAEFQELCRQNSAGMVFFALNNKGYFADCQSMKVLKTVNSGRIASYQVPFYTRVRGIETAFWKFDGSQISDYNRHYRSLLVD